MASTLSFSLLIFLSTLSLISSQSSYTLPDHYFINCGSNSDIEFTSKTFIGDDKHTDFSFSGGHTAVNNHPTSNTSEIYQSARVFTKKSDYKLEADVTNTFVMVRLHFSPFSANGFDLSNSKFDVSVSGFSLLSNFNAGDSTIIKEFIIPIGSDRKFRIVFTPSSGSSPAFVNAIEAFTTPSELFVHDALTPYISPFGKIDDVNNISSSYAFKPVYRVNVGGQSIAADLDTLRRNWISDDQFISDIEHAETVNPFEPALTHKQDSASSFDAPDAVYITARELTNSLVNLTWSFEVDKNTMFIVRAHFCDIKSKGLNNSNDAFNFFIYSHYSKVINPGDIVQTVQVPFYMDFVVDSEESGSVNVSIGTIKGISQPAFLNGLEIMELSMNSGVVDSVNDGKSSKKVYIVAGCAVGGLLLVLLISFCIGLKCRKTKKPVVGAKTGSNAVPSYGRSSYTSISIDFTINNPSPIPNLNLRFQLADILQVTNGFDESLVIGKGGFGKVYKGTFPDGNTVAVKRGEKGHEQGRPEFVTEIMVL